MSPADLRLGRWQDVLVDVEQIDALIVDAPYSDRTHRAYRDMAAIGRRALSYDSFTSAAIDQLVAAWAPRTRGWFVTLTDHVLAPAWADALERIGRYVFAPIACMEPGSRVRLVGDGPTQWSVWAVVARPKTQRMQRWGSLPGGYVVPMIEGRNGVLGCKPLWLMRAIIRDYTRPGDLVCDPCAGGGTTLLAALQEGRRAIGAECMPEHYEIARKRLARGFTPPLFAESAGQAEQLELDGDAS
jgi:site-specific DNA-methyltransferase (adenine-specific)